jgi:hypothetical protein
MDYITDIQGNNKTFLDTDKPIDNPINSKVFLEEIRKGIDIVKKNTGIKPEIWQIKVAKTMEECLVFSDVIKYAGDYKLQFLKKENDYYWFREV